MHKQFSLIILFIFTAFTLVNAQKEKSSDCKVLHPKLDSIYKGDCKRGLAHGKGTAIGEDIYTGKFKRGLPHGKGKLFANDSTFIYEGRWKKGKMHGRGTLVLKRENKKDSTIEGRWSKGELVRKTNETSPYKVTRKRGVSRVNFFRQSEGNEIAIKFKRSGTYSRVGVQGLYYSSGYQTSESYPLRIEGVSFPFEGRVVFNAPNLLNSSSNEYRVSFQIDKPGYWEVIVFY